MIKHMDVFLRIMAAVGLALIVVACNLDREPTPTLEVTQPVVVTLEPVSFEPIAGTRVAWVDMSYIVYVPPGDFLMGQDETEPSDHAPAHTVTLDGFWIHQTEVTNRMYAECVALGFCTEPYRETGKPYWYANAAHADAPVVGVDWAQAETYCEWIDGRLPTEAEWEKAARGTEGDPYPWGEEEPTCDLLNYDDDCFEPPSPVDVRTFFPGASPFELADTAGNASEWVHDWFDEDYYSLAPVENPTGPGEGDLRVVRGSNYASLAEDVPVYLRTAVDPLEHHAEIGFRCVLSGETVGNPPPQACEMPVYSPPAVDTGELPEPVFLSVTPLDYCLEDDGGMMHGYVNLTFDEPVEIGTYNITSSAGPVTVMQDPAHLDTLVLSGVGIPLESPIELTICPALPAPPLPVTEPLCPGGYTFDSASGKCRYLDLTPGEPCDVGEAWMEGYGCVRTAGEDLLDQLNLEINCSLSPGYHVVEISDSPHTSACLPIDGPQDCLDDDNCSLSKECLPGLTYVPDLDCCARPPELDPVCLAGYHYDPVKMLCIPYYPEQCLSFTVFIPSCREPEISICQNPGQYGDQSSCEAAHCLWVDAVTRVPYCTYP